MRLNVLARKRIDKTIKLVDKCLRKERAVSTTPGTHWPKIYRDELAEIERQRKWVILPLFMNLEDADGEDMPTFVVYGARAQESWDVFVNQMNLIMHELIDLVNIDELKSGIVAIRDGRGDVRLQGYGRTCLRETGTETGKGSCD